ncbi:carbohydrate kinase family protein [Rhodococcus sp. SGAir0479]|uniref:carbohydrate kinase family protein n=1 Tax=Rhodococcus sp. SGAir0479 TaxID=2567884 RepID=UPI0010CCBDF9|nr:carbohydrate kinase [Rhodococcus sp. SGAir0479]QCQ89912.1 carbohydrate kinase [Rhodococcus sp. SGAir0479]
MSDPRILVCGEALVDLVPTGETTYDARLGGGPFNVAVTLGRLGSSVALCSRISTDPFGERLFEALAGAGVDTRLVQRGPEPTTLAVAGLDPDGGARYTFYADGTADRLVADPGTLPASVRAVSVGTLSLVFEPGASVYAALLRRAHDDGCLTVLDPNVRPAVFPDHYRRRFVELLPSVDVLKVSDDDVRWLAAGADGTTPAQWLEAGVTAVVTTHGADGLSVRTRALEVAVPGAAVAVADTIGAGDTVHGALLHRLVEAGPGGRGSIAALDGGQWRDVLGFAAAAAAITVSRPGADPPWATELTGG